MNRVCINRIGRTIVKVPGEAGNTGHILGEGHCIRSAHVHQILRKGCIRSVNNNLNVIASVASVVIPDPVIKVVGTGYHRPECRRLDEVIIQRTNVPGPGMLRPGTGTACRITVNYLCYTAAGIYRVYYAEIDNRI